VLYLDTTYCRPHFTFMDQSESLEQIAQVVHAELAREPATLFLLGSYSIGMEKVLGFFEGLGFRV
jgi:DNA cross-link repair 1A protein